VAAAATELLKQGCAFLRERTACRISARAKGLPIRSGQHEEQDKKQQTHRDALANAMQNAEERRDVSRNPRFHGRFRGAAARAGRWHPVTSPMLMHSGQATRLPTKDDGTFVMPGRQARIAGVNIVNSGRQKSAYALS